MKATQSIPAADHFKYRRFMLFAFCLFFLSFLYSTTPAANADESKKGMIYIWYDQAGKKHATMSPPPEGALDAKGFPIFSSNKRMPPMEAVTSGNNTRDLIEADDKASFPPAKDNGEKKDQADATETLKVEIDSDKVIVPVTIISKESSSDTGVNLRLLMDTGASKTVIFREPANGAGIGPERTINAQMADGTIIQADLAVLDKIFIGNAFYRNVEVSVIDRFNDNLEFDGLLGMDILKRMKYEIDFTRKVMNFSLN